MGFLLEEVADDGQQNVRSWKYGIQLSLSPAFLGHFLYVFWVQSKTLKFFGFTDYSPSASFLESKFDFLNLSILSLNNFLCCHVGSSYKVFFLSDFSTSVTITAPSLSALVIIFSFIWEVPLLLFVLLWTDWDLGFSFLIFNISFSHFVRNQLMQLCRSGYPQVSTFVCILFGRVNFLDLPLTLDCYP